MIPFLWLFIILAAGSTPLVEANKQESLQELELGNQLLGKSQFADALSHYHKAIDLDPSNYQALYRRSTTYQIIGRPNTALIDLETILKLKPDFHGARQQLANILLKQGKLDEAEQHFRILSQQKSEDSQILKKIDEVSTLREHFAEIQKAIEEYNDCNLAVDLISQIIETQNLNPSLYRKRAKCYETQSEFREAVKDLRHIIKLSGAESTGEMLEASQILYKIGKIEDSLGMIRECLKINQDHKQCLAFYKKIRKISKTINAIKSAKDAEDWEKCVEKAEKAIETFKYDGNDRILDNIYRLTCICHRENGNLDQAIADCSTILENEGQDWEILFERGEAYLADDQFDQAIADFEKVLELQSGYGKAQESLKKAKAAKERGSQRDYYKILGVKRSAKKREIIKAYRKMAQKWHPDNFSNEEEKKKAEKKFIDIAAAKEVLTDEEKRQQFDSGHDPLDPDVNKRGEGHGHPFGHGFNPFGGGGRAHRQEQGGQTFYYFYQ